MFNFIDLFAGIGGFRCGLAPLGGNCVFTSEYDKFAVQTYSNWYQDSPVFTEDIRTIDRLQVPKHDLLAAGFPCQPFSLAGVSKKASLGRPHGFNDLAQGTLFFQICEIAELHRPKILLLENVKNLLSHDGGRTWDVIKQCLADLDYVVFHNVVDAQYWVPQHRERVFIVAYASENLKKKRRDCLIWPDLPKKKLRVAALLDPAPDTKYMLGSNTWKCLKKHKAKHRKKGNGFGFGICDPEGISRTLSHRYHKDGAEILIEQKGWQRPRRLTPKEAMALMGFNTRYAKLFGHREGFPICVSDTQAYMQFGNSVVPEVVEYVSRTAINYFREHCLAKHAATFGQSPTE